MSQALIKSTTLMLPIVGAHFRPPAKQVLAALPFGAELRLQPEPENPYDGKAIQVWVDPKLALATRLCDLSGTGWDESDLIAEGEIQIGYVSDSDSKFGKKAILESNASGNREAHALIAGLRPGVNDVLVAWEEAKPLISATMGTLPNGNACVILRTRSDVEAE